MPVADPIDLGTIFLSTCKSKLQGLARSHGGEFVTLSVDEAGQEKVDGGETEVPHNIFDESWMYRKVLFDVTFKQISRNPWSSVHLRI